jgi:adenylate cyclase
MARFANLEEEWKAFLEGTHPALVRERRIYRLIPSGPRCKVCFAPFGLPGGLVFRRLRWDKNPNICTGCIRTLSRQEVAGAEAEISFMFADVRRSSELARRLGTTELAHVMQRFYATASDVLLSHDAILDKFVGDEVVGFFMPFMTGPGHATVAVKAAQDLLRATGHADPDGPWLPLGAGVNTGTAFVGMVSRGGAAEFTAFGDSINVAAHVAAEAGPGEILVTGAAAAAAGIGGDGLARRRLVLKGYQVDAVVVPVSASHEHPRPHPASGFAGHSDL